MAANEKSKANLIKGRGRKVGSTNKVGAEAKAEIARVLNLGISLTLEQDLSLLSPKDRINAYAALAKYVIPVQRETTIDANITSQISPKLIEDFWALADTITDEEIEDL